MLTKQLSILLVIMLMFGFTATVSAEEAADAEIASGIVTKITAESISILEDEMDGESVLRISIEKDTMLENVDSIDEIVNGDEVFVDYIYQGEELKATNLFKVHVYGDEWEEEYVQQDQDDMMDIEEPMDDELDMIQEEDNDIQEEK